MSSEQVVATLRKLSIRRAQLDASIRKGQAAVAELSREVRGIERERRKGNDSFAAVREQLLGARDLNSTSPRVTFEHSRLLSGVLNAQRKRMLALDQELGPLRKRQASLQVSIQAQQKMTDKIETMQHQLKQRASVTAAAQEVEGLIEIASTHRCAASDSTIPTDQASILRSVVQNFVIDGEQQADLNDVGQDQFELAYEQQTEEYFIEDTAFSSSSDQSCSEHGDSPKGGESFQQASCEPSNSHQDSNTFKDVTSKPQEAFNRALLTEDMLERLHSFESWETHAQQGVSFCYGIRQGVDVEVRIVRKADGGLELVLQGNAKLTRHELQQTRYRIEQALQNAGLPLSSTTLGMQND